MACLPCINIFSILNTHRMSLMRQCFSVIIVESCRETRCEWDLFVWSWLTRCQCQNSNQQQHSDDVDGYLIPSAWRISPHPYCDFSECTDFHLISHKIHRLSDMHADRKTIADDPSRWYSNSYQNAFWEILIFIIIFIFIIILARKFDR